MRFQQIKNHVQDTQMTARQIARQRASELGLTQDEINYLDAPILAVHYVSKYGISKDDIALACAKRRITSVMSHGVLWVSDRPLKKLGWF